MKVDVKEVEAWRPRKFDRAFVDVVSHERKGRQGQGMLNIEMFKRQKDELAM